MQPMASCTLATVALVAAAVLATVAASNGASLPCEKTGACARCKTSGVTSYTPCKRNSDCGTNEQCEWYRNPSTDWQQFCCAQRSSITPVDSLPCEKTGACARCKSTGSISYSPCKRNSDCRNGAQCEWYRNPNTDWQQFCCGTGTTVTTHAPTTYRPSSYRCADGSVGGTTCATDLDCQRSSYAQPICDRSLRQCCTVRRNNAPTCASIEPCPSGHVCQARDGVPICMPRVITNDKCQFVRCATGYLCNSQNGRCELYYTSYTYPTTYRVPTSTHTPFSSPGTPSTSSQCLSSLACRRYPTPPSGCVLRNVRRHLITQCYSYEVDCAQALLQCSTFRPGK